MMNLLLKRGVMALLVIVAAAHSAFAEVRINIRGGRAEPLPIAISDFMSKGDLGPQISAVIAADPVSYTHLTLPTN